MPYQCSGCSHTTSRRRQRALLGGHVDQVVGIQRVQVAHLHASGGAAAACISSR
jgi:hypothetical protein